MINDNDINDNINNYIKKQQEYAVVDKYSIIPENYIKDSNSYNISQRYGNLLELGKEYTNKTIPYNLPNIEWSIGMKELFKKIKLNNNFCILYIPNQPRLRNNYDLYDVDYWYDYAEVGSSQIDMRPKNIIDNDSSYFTLGILSKVFIDLDIQIQIGINYISYKDCYKIVNSLFAYYTNNGYIRNFTSNFGDAEADEGLKFDSYEGIIGLNFVLPFIFRIIFTTYNFNFYSYWNINIDSLEPFKQSKSMLNFLFYSSQTDCIFNLGLKTTIPGIKPPDGLDWSNKLVGIVWNGQDRKLDSKISLEAKTKNQVVETNMFPGVYTPVTTLAYNAKYVFDLLQDAIIKDTIPNTSIFDYEYCLFEFFNYTTNKMNNVIVYLPSSDTPFVFMFECYNFYLMVTNKTNKKSLFFGTDSITQQIRMTKNSNLLKHKYNKSLNMQLLTMIYRENTIGTALQSNKPTENPAGYLFPSAEKLEFRSVRIVKIFETDCFKIEPDYNNPSTSQYGDNMYKFNFTYEPFNKNDFNMTPSPGVIVYMLDYKREKTGIEVL